MTENAYKASEIVGSSRTSLDDAVRAGVARAEEIMVGGEWFEVLQTRGHIKNGKITLFQALLRIGRNV